MAHVSFALTILLIPFRSRLDLLPRSFPPIYADYTDFLLFATDITLLAALGLWLVSLILEPHPVKLGPLYMTLPIVGFTSIGLLSAFFSIDPPLSLYHSIRLIILLGMYLFVINEVRSVRQTILPIAGMLFIQSVVGIIQALSQRSVGLQSLGELILNPEWNGVSVVWADGIRSLRAYGLTDHPNILGGCLAFGMLLIACWYIDPESKWRPAISGIFSLSTLALLYTFSRSAWLALLSGIGSIAILLITSKQKPAIRALFGLMAVSLLLLAPFVWQNAGLLGVRFNWQGSFRSVAQENQSIGERLLLNRAANEIFTEHALIGVGLGAFPRALQAKYPEFSLDYQPAHMTLLDVAAEIGIFGALFYTIVMVAPWIALYSKRKYLIFSPELLGVIALLIAVSVVGFFDYYTWLLAPGRLWQWLAWGLWGSVFGAFRGKNG
jgi:O-antigen ligase